MAKPDDTADTEPEVVWRPAADLPAPERERKGQLKKYDLHLAGQPVLRTFSHIAGVFAGEQNRAGSLLNSATVGLADLRGLGSEQHAGWSLPCSALPKSLIRSEERRRRRRAWPMERTTCRSGQRCAMTVATT